MGLLAPLSMLVEINFLLVEISNCKGCARLTKITLLISTLLFLSLIK